MGVPQLHFPQTSLPSKPCNQRAKQMALSLFGLLGFSRRDAVKIEQDVWRGTISYPLKLFFTVSAALCDTE